MGPLSQLAADGDRDGIVNVADYMAGHNYLNGDFEVSAGRPKEPEESVHVSVLVNLWTTRWPDPRRLAVCVKVVLFHSEQ